MVPRNVWFGATLATGILLDQGTKAWVSSHLQFGIDEMPLIQDWFSLVQARNTGAAFSTMEGQMHVFHAFTVVCIAVVLVLLRSIERDARFVPFTLGMILSGALGNWIDRLRLGYVVDFLKVYVGSYEPLRSWLIDRFHTNVWPIFNVADSMLLVGVVLFAGYYLLQREGDEAEDPAIEPDPAG